MKSIDRMRHEIGSYAWRDNRDIAMFDELADAIEAEVAERYMELPLDADGVPVHVGDMMLYEGGGGPKEVHAVTATSVYLVDDGPRHADMCRHHQPDTWERIIEDAILRGYDEPHAEKGGYITKESLVARCKALAGGE